MSRQNIVSREQWNTTHKAFLEKEKALTRAHDELAAQRRRLPWESVTDTYVFKSPTGSVTLADLFEGRSQLILYHHMLKPGDTQPCAGCGMVSDNIGHTAHLHARDTTLALVAKAPIAEIEAFRQRMAWSIPWYETTDDFNANFGVTDGFGLNVFIRDNNDIFRTYFTSGRGIEMLGSHWSFLDLTPYGRQESWEDSPAGTPQSAPYQWWRLHDEY